MTRKIQKSGLAKCKTGSFGFFERKFAGKSKPAEIYKIMRKSEPAETYKIMAKFQAGREIQGNRKFQDNRKTQDSRKTAT